MKIESPEPVGARDALAGKVVLGQGPLLPILEGGGVKVEPVVDVDLCPPGDVPDDSHHLVALVAEPHGVRVAAVVEKGHGGKDGPADWNDVKLGDVVVLEDALGHLEAVGGGHLEVPEEEAGHENLCLFRLHRLGRLDRLAAAEEAVVLQALAHEDGLGRLLDEVLERPPVRVGRQVVDGPVGGRVKLDGLSPKL